MNLFFLDTSTAIASLAIKCDRSVFYAESSAPNSHIEELDDIFNNLLLEAKIDSTSIQAIVIGSGPGSFTGLRIGYSYASGLAVGLKAPVLQVSGFMAGCLGYLDRADVFISLSDARRSEVFMQVFNKNNGMLNPLTSCSIAKISDLHEVRRKYSENEQKVIFVGSLAESAVPDIEVVPPFKIAAGMAANFRFDSSSDFSFVKLANITPEYLRPVSALKISERASTTN